MTRVGVLPHASQPQSRALAARIVAWLGERGREAYLTPEDAAGLGIPGAALDRDDFRKLDLLVVLGGDGTMLHGVDLAGFAGVPILGVNFGRLGFLTEVSSDRWESALEAVLAGDHAVDERSTVSAAIVRANGSTDPLGEAINEVSVERAVGGKMIRMSITVGGQEFTSVGADGIILATPTGSTAYAFSMRGPVVSPDLRCLIVVAVGAHALFDRPLVVSEGHDVEVVLEPRGRGVVVTDGRPRTEIGEGDRLRAVVGPSTVRLVRVDPDSYFTRVARRFGLPRRA